MGATDTKDAVPGAVRDMNTTHTEVITMDLSFLDDLWRGERPPDSFTSAEAAETWDITREVAGKRLQQMVKKGKLLRTELAKGSVTYYWQANGEAPTQSGTP